MAQPSPFAPATLADLPAFGAAHATDLEAGTGCTVCVAPKGATCGVDVRGGAPATRETDLLRPENTVDAVQAVVLSGGSAFGLAAATGVMEALAERKIGFELAGCCVPIVVGASLFDLPVGEPVAPGAAAGRQAAEAAFAAQESSSALEMGNVGAGTGATVGKFLGPAHAMKGGFGWDGARAGEVAAVALVAVNAAGNVIAADGAPIAGAQVDGAIMSAEEALAASADQMAMPQAGENTTIGIVLTNARLSKAEAQKVAQMAHDAYARAIRPVHTTGDGDAIFACASGEVGASVDAVGMLACAAMEGAVRKAVLEATSAYGLIAARDLPPRQG